MQNAGLRGVMEASTQISKAGLGSQAMCGRVAVPQVTLERAICEVVIVKPKLQWRCSM
jgi:hypothetical protein